MSKSKKKRKKKVNPAKPDPSQEHEADQPVSLDMSFEEAVIRLAQVPASAVNTK